MGLELLAAEAKERGETPQGKIVDPRYVTVLENSLGGVQNPLRAKGKKAKKASSELTDPYAYFAFLNEIFDQKGEQLQGKVQDFSQQQDAISAAFP